VAPFTSEDILRMEDQPRTKPVPAEIAKRLAEHRIVLSSPDGRFDPRERWTRIKGAKGAWELVTPGQVSSGLLVEKMGRLGPRSLGRTATDLAPSRPPWQPFIYHPKRVAPEVGPRRMRRRNGTEVHPLTVFNRDDRDMFFPFGYPWHCVGKVLVTTARGPATFGTGTLVGSRTVLTAEHVIPWGAPGLSIRFVPGYFSPALSVVLGLGTAPQSWVTHVWGHVNALKDGRPGLDVAVLRLADPLGDWLGTLGARVYDDDWEDETWWTLVGYPSVVGVTASGSTPNNAEFPTRQFGISVEDDDADGSGLELETYADVTRGNSGGPLFGYWAEGPYVIGVMSAEERSTAVSRGTNIAAGGNAMLNLVHWARANWP
jgi:hypothetical protein